MVTQLHSYTVTQLHSYTVTQLHDNLFLLNEKNCKGDTSHLLLNRLALLDINYHSGVDVKSTNGKPSNSNPKSLLEIRHPGVDNEFIRMTYEILKEYFNKNLSVRTLSLCFRIYDHNGEVGGLSEPMRQAFHKAFNVECQGKAEDKVDGCIGYIYNFSRENLAHYERNFQVNNSLNFVNAGQGQGHSAKR